MYHPLQQTFFNLFTVVDNPRFHGCYCIKYPSGRIEPVRGNQRQVEMSIFNITSQELQKEMETLLSLYKNCTDENEKLEWSRKMNQLIGLRWAIAKLNK